MSTDSLIQTISTRRRADVILIRRTDRLPFAAPTEWESFEPLLRLAFDTDAVRLDVMSDDVRGELAEMSKLTDSLRLYDSAYHSELNWWTPSFEFSEGIPYSSLVSADEIQRVDFGRTFPLPQHRERRAEVPGDHSKILALSTYGDSRKDALLSGEVLSGPIHRLSVSYGGTTPTRSASSGLVPRCPNGGRRNCELSVHGAAEDDVQRFDRAVR